MSKGGQYALVGTAAIATLLLFSSIVAAAPPSWSLVLSGQDISRTASLRDHAGVPELNFSAVAPLVNLRIAVSGNTVTFTSASGKHWSGNAGDFSLAGDSGHIQLSAPLRLEGTAVYLPLDTLFEVAEVEVSMDADAHVARINPHGDSATGVGSSKKSDDSFPALAPLVNPPNGWGGFTVEKTDAEKQETARLDHRPESQAAMAERARITGILKEPDRKEALFINTEDSYVYGHDGAMPITGFGKLAGFDTDFSALPTLGTLGVRFLSGQINFGDRAAGWYFSGGDLYSDIWGLARGVRFTDQISKNFWVAPAIYFQTKRDGTDKPVISVANVYDFNKHLAISTEVNSNVSVFGRATVDIGRFTGSVFYRNANMVNGKSNGYSAGYQVLTRLGVSADYTSMGSGLDRIIARNAGARWTIYHQLSLSLIESRTLTGYYKMRADSALLGLPMNRVRLNVRYQHRTLDYLLGNSPVLGSPHVQYNQVSPDLSLRFNSRVLLEEQVVAEWGPGIPLTKFDQFTASAVATQKLDFSISTSLINPRDTLRLLGRVQYKIRPTLSFITEYGSIPPYQNVPPTVNPQTPNVPAQPIKTQGFRFTIRKTWRVDTPTRGGQVEGYVLDAKTLPVRGAVVEAGPYSTQTDDHGMFYLRKLPRGEYTVKVREQSVPADLNTNTEAVHFTSEPGRFAFIPFSMVNLREIHGRVIMDTKETGGPDEAEGVGMITLKLGEEVTSSMTDGRFGFYNLAPGMYTVKVVTASLPNGLAMASDQEITLQVSPNGPIPEILFRLKKKPDDIRYINPTQDFIITSPTASAAPAKQGGSNQPNAVRNNP